MGVERLVEETKSPDERLELATEGVGDPTGPPADRSGADAGHDDPAPVGELKGTVHAVGAPHRQHAGSVPAEHMDHVHVLEEGVEVILRSLEQSEHLNRCTLVGESCGELVDQVALIAGRGWDQGEPGLVTQDPDPPVIQWAIEVDHPTSTTDGDGTSRGILLGHGSIRGKVVADLQRSNIA